MRRSSPERIRKRRTPFASRSWLAATLAIAVGMLPVGTPRAETPLRSDWARDAVWDDGQAEVATYDATRTIYGAPRAYEAVLIAVKEELDTSRWVKAEGWRNQGTTMTVLKLNAVREIPTPNYPYRMMTSVFVERDRPDRLVKLTSGSHEWCGNTWKSIRRAGEGLSYHWESYFAGEADGLQRLQQDEGALFRDQLPLALRGLEFRDGATGRLRLAPSMATTHAGSVDWETVTLRISGPEALELPAGRFQAYRVDLDGRVDSSWWFDAEGTHLLLKMQGDDGDRLVLRDVTRRAYWKLP